MKSLADYLRGHYFWISILAPLPGGYGNCHREAGARRNFGEDELVALDDGRSGDHKEMHGQSGVAAGDQGNGLGRGRDIGYFLKGNVGMALSFFAYSLANVGFILANDKIMQ